MAEIEPQTALRTARRIALLIGSYLWHLLVEAAQHLARIGLDLIYAIRLLLLLRARRLTPERAPQIDSTLARLRGDRSKRWAGWKAAPLLRQIELRAASVLLVLIAVLAGRAYFTASSPEVMPSPEATFISGITPSPRAPQAAATSAAISNEQMGDEFTKRRKKAAPGEWLLYGRPVLDRGELGQWDDFTVRSPVVLRDGRRLRMWYVGCHLLGDEHTCGVGHATSRDGLSWDKSADPVLALEPSDGLNALAVVQTPDRFLMWYALAPDLFEQRDCATLNLATSRDGLHFKTQGAVLRANCNNTREIEPSVLYDSKVFHLWYFDAEAEALAHFTSPDGQRWQRAGNTPISTLKIGTLAEGLGRLAVFPDPSVGYQGLVAFPGAPEQESQGFFAVLQSPDGNLWKIANESRTTGAAHRYPIVAEMPCGLVDSDGVRVWFAARSNDGSDTIQLVFRKGEW
jgi:hypothetical protein